MKLVRLNKHTKIRYFDDNSSINNFIVSKIKRINCNKNFSNIIFSGGRSLLGLFVLLDEKKIFKNCSNLYLSDERLVKQNNIHSNYKILNSFFGKKKYLNIFNIYESYINYKEKNSKNYLSKISQEVPPHNKIDAAILGVGKDGHIASIFEDMFVIDSNNILVILKNKYEKFDRISFSLEYLSKIKKIYIIINDDEKKYLIDKLLSKKYTSQKILFKFINKSKTNIEIITKK